jgi:CBS domain-containing protein
MLQAKDIMTTGVITVAADATVAEIAKLLIDNRISAVPVVDADKRVLGIVSEGDLMRRAENETERHRSWWLAMWELPEERAADYIHSHGRTAGEVMTRDVATVSEDASLGEIAELLEERRIKRVPVLRDGRLVGIVSRANLLHGLATAAKPAAPASTEDRALRERVATALRSDLGVMDTLINVIAKDGVVDLWGEVPTETELRAIVVAAERVTGVREVRHHIFVPTEAVRSLDWGF